VEGAQESNDLQRQQQQREAAVSISELWRIVEQQYIAGKREVLSWAKGARKAMTWT
jgi:hypothetical protein